MSYVPGKNNGLVIKGDKDENCPAKQGTNWMYKKADNTFAPTGRDFRMACQTFWGDASQPIEIPEGNFSIHMYNCNDFYIV